MMMKNRAPIEEDKLEDDEDENQSSKARAQEQELKAINDGYTRSDPESANVANLSKQGMKNKPGNSASERVFAPFKSPFTEEIINTSKELRSSIKPSESDSGRASGQARNQN